MSIETILKPILAKLSNVNKHQRTFLTELFAVLLGRQGKATFENLARYARFTEGTFRRQFATCFDWLTFNKACVDFSQGPYIGIVDCSFLPKSGSRTFGLDKFWSSCAGKAQRGLEVSVLACVNTITKQCFALEASQTPPNITQQEDKPYSRLNWYLEQLADCLPHLPALLYWVADGYYAKKEVFTLLVQQRRHLITRLRHEAALYHLWTKGREPGQRGPTRRYDGKAVFDNLARWQHQGVHPIHAHIALYSALLYSKHFERSLRVLLLLDTRSQKYVLLASTNPQQSASQIAYYYHLRFQIELYSLQIKKAGGLQRGKTDAIDAIRIAEYAYRFRDKMRLWQPPRPVLQKLAALSALRQQLIGVRRQLEQPLAEQQTFWASSLHKQLSKTCQAALTVIRADLTSVEKQIQTLIEQDDRLKELFNWITSIPGLGSATATELLVATDEFNAISDPKKLAASAVRLSCWGCSV